MKNKLPIDYSDLLYDELLEVELPGRYVGGEFGVKKPYEPGMLSAGICFPDLYEIGMSNTAIKILYDLVNAVPGYSAQRVFAPAPDFSQVLKRRNIPLYTLESQIPLHDLDILAVTVGYELSATNILSILDHGNIPLHAKDRQEEDPLVLAGGPAITNPAPFETFFDGIYIGEAEQAFPKMLYAIRDMKTSGKSRSEILEWLTSQDYIYHAGKQKVRRCIDAASDFSERIPVYFTVPSIKVVQDHGAVEIMRGCPNGCRFCHAGIVYRPYRQASAAKIFERVDHFVFTQGYDNITLSSLSTGDYPNLSDVVKNLDEVYGKSGVSFGLPSLKIDSFTLDLLEEVSRVRKSGLTFAVETPTDEGQRAINKQVPLDKVLSILQKAKSRGWKLAKFYFMIGLPGDDPETISQQIIDYISFVERTAKIQLHVNIGTFIPKPHTPYQWSRQLTEEESLEIFRTIKHEFRKHPYIKIAYHDPFVSTLEGIISRGDRRVGELIEKAYFHGAYLDAWGDHLKKDIWRNVFQTSSWDVVAESLAERDKNGPLPWNSVHIGVNHRFLSEELERTFSGEKTKICKTACMYPCGVCTRYIHPLEEQQLAVPSAELCNTYNEKHTKYTNVDGKPLKVLLKYTKQGAAVFLSHINVMKIFERSFRRAEIPVSYSEGYNPKPKIDFAHPLSLGVASRGEYLVFHTKMEIKELENRLNTLYKYLPEGFEVTNVKYVAVPGKFSLMAQYGGAAYYLTTKESQELKNIAKQYDHVLITDSDDQGVVLTLHIDEGKPDLFKLTSDKYGFIKKYRPLRLETFNKDRKPLDQSSFLT